MITYRDAAVADAAALAKLGADTFLETFGHLYTPADVDLYLADTGEERWAADLADPAFAIRTAEADGTLIAFAKLGPPHMTSTPARDVELRQLYVRRPWHGTGVAATLMEWAKDTARTRGAAALFLGVYPDNHRARRFYARLGFESVGSHACKVGNQVDQDIVMRLAL